ncbi:MAG: hypothetical protein IJG23_07600 [Clostridia bacterium]|nr:hypothetical protein [Clostridia bacterium]
MSKSIEKDTQKSKKKVLIAKILVIVAAILFVVWGVYSIVTNPNQNERFLLNSFVKHYRELEQPASYKLKDCSAYHESTTTAGKAFKYAIIEVEKDGKSETLLLIVDGKNNGKVFEADALSAFDCADKGSVRFEITDHQEGVNLSKVQKTIDRYWDFHDKD